MNPLAGPDSPGKPQAYDIARADLWDRYVGLGLERLHPVIPPSAVPSRRWLDWQINGRGRPERAMSEDRATALWFARNATGKLPGVWAADGWSPRNVQNLKQAYTPDRLIDYRLMVIRHGGGIGVSGSELIGLDIDVIDSFACLEVQAALFGILRLPRTCIRRIGRAPKLLIPFRLAQGALRFAKPTKLILADGKSALEWLVSGQQWVLEGTHGGTGRDYWWPWGRLWERPGGLSALPEIDEDAAVGTLRKLRHALRLKGKPIHKGVLPGTRNHTTGPRVAHAALMCDEADARSMIAAIPNRLTTPREDYVAVAHHLMGCSGGAAWGRDLFMTWASQWPGGPDPHHDAVLWDGISDVRSGCWQLMKLAVSHGWTGKNGLMVRQAQRAFAAIEGGN